MPYEKILIAVDSSEYSKNATLKGFELAHQLNAKVALLYVVDTSKALGNIDAGVFPAEALKTLKKEVTQTLDQLVKMYNGKELVKFMPEGHPMEEVLKTAETWWADLIVMGTHGRTGLKHVLMGSVAEHIVRHSKVPLMIVPLKK
jgi:nucleotide-binding universal stress UspA family protein